MIGDIYVYDNEGITGKILSWLFKDRHTHVAIQVDDLRVIESTPFGTKMRLMNNRNCCVLRYRHPTPRQMQRIIQFVRERLNAKYDWKLVIGIALHRLFGLHTELDDRSRYICTELIIEAFLQVGIRIVEDTERHLMPEDLIESEYLTLISERRVK